MESSVTRGRSLRSARRRSPLRRIPLLAAWIGSALALLAPPAARALVRLDFEQRYYTHPGTQVWDFCLIRPDSVYHIFYHGIPEATPHASFADTIWHATSPDLKHWNDPAPVLEVSDSGWESAAIWAPDVVWDDGSQRWMMAYTACDGQLNQRIALAESADLSSWSKLPQNPVIEPDANQYLWNPQDWWSNFRDPFLYRAEDRWNILVTASQWLGRNTGVLYHAVSDDLLQWTDVGPLFANDGAEPWRVLESPQYLVRGTTHHLLFGEYDSVGVSLVSGESPEDWTMAERTIIDYGYAPEVKRFDEGVDLFARLAPYQNPQQSSLSYVVRIDTLRNLADGAELSVYRPHPLGDDWASWTGTSNLASPTFGDNPAFRGETPAGTIGNGYFGSAEYYQGPLSGRGAPGTRLGDAATGTLTSRPFVITGERMQLHVGGGNHPQTCYVALVRADDDEILYRETGADVETMSLREWDLAPYRGQVAYIRIVDAETGAFGHLNVDEIVELAGEAGVAPEAAPRRLSGLSAYPNPFNPRTVIRFQLDRDSTVRLRLLDLRGRTVWDSGLRSAVAGENRIVWEGCDPIGRAAPAGSYLYCLTVDGAVAGSGKLTLLK